MLLYCNVYISLYYNYGSIYKEPIEIVDNKKKYTDKAMASIKELIQTEKNYIENLKAIQPYLNYFERSNAEASPYETDKRKFSISNAIRKMSIANLNSVNAVVDSKNQENDTSDLNFESFVPMPERLRSGRYKICMGNFKALINFHER